jgi:hypothetical protein
VGVLKSHVFRVKRIGALLPFSLSRWTALLLLSRLFCMICFPPFFLYFFPRFLFVVPLLPLYGMRPILTNRTAA